MAAWLGCTCQLFGCLAGRRCRLCKCLSTTATAAATAADTAAAAASRGAAAACCAVNLLPVLLFHWPLLHHPYSSLVWTQCLYLTLSPHQAVEEVALEVAGGKNMQGDQSLKEVGQEAAKQVEWDGNRADKEQLLGVK